MAAVAGGVLLEKVFGHSNAEKALRPWWDVVEDYMVYGLVMLGLVVAPTAVINGTPLDCTFCKGEHCKEAFGPDFDYNFTDPGYNNWWTKKLCTLTSIDEFVIYFPYILIGIGLVIIMIERIFVNVFKTSAKVELFYDLLVKELLDGSSTEESELENTKDCIEVRHSFKDSNNYFQSYLIRTIIEIFVAILLLLWLILRGMPSLEIGETIFCDVHGFVYECSGVPHQFYMYVMFISLGVIVVYLICSFYNLLWLVFPPLGALSSLMSDYCRELRAQSPDTGAKDEDLLGDLYDIYFRNKDLKLLLDLLAESNGLATSLRIMALFDKTFRVKVEPCGLSVFKSKHNEVDVEFEDSHTVKHIFGRIRQVKCIYTVEIIPPAGINAVEAFVSEEEIDAQKRTVVKIPADAELQPILSDNQKRLVKFSELDPAKEYTIRASTVVNGKTIARKLHKIKPEGKETKEEEE